MRHIFYIVALLASFLFCSCDQKESISDEEKHTIEMEVKVRLDGYPEALKNKDMEWLHTFWSDDRGFVLAGDGLMQTNYDTAITRTYLDAFANLRELLYFKWGSARAHVLGKNAVSYSTDFDWRMLMVPGDTIRAKGSWLYVFKKYDTVWKVVQSAGTHTYYK